MNRSCKLRIENCKLRAGLSLIASRSICNFQFAIFNLRIAPDRSHLDTATTAQDVAQGPDREPSSARSAFNCAGSVESVYARHCVRGRCEPRTARGQVAISRCALRNARGELEIEFLRGQARLRHHGLVELPGQARDSRGSHAADRALAGHAV